MAAKTGTHHEAKAEASHFEKMLGETVERARAAIEKVEEPHLRAMFETTAEVLLGLTKAFRDYGTRDEPGFK